MRSLKSVFGLIGALLSVLYSGYLFYDLFDVAGSVEEAKENGLGPTLLGLGIVFLLVCIPLIVKLVRIFGGPRLPKSGGRGSDDTDSDSDFDPDAVIARYMARQPKEAATVAPAAPPAPRNNRPAGPASFGRRSR